MGTLVNGIKEIFATSQTTATHLPVCASDGTPQGRISVGDLASVLGANKPNGQVVGDLNNYGTTGLYLVYNSGQAHKPSFNSGLLLVYQFSTVHTMQIFWSNEDTVSFRHRWASATNWGDWVEITSIPSFYKNYATIASLKSDGIGIKTTTIERQAAAQSPYFSNKWVIDTGISWTNRLVIGFLDNRNGWHYNFTHDSTNWYIVFEDNTVPSGEYGGTLVYLQM